MRILLSARHRYPAGGLIGTSMHQPAVYWRHGRRPGPARGLAELGHEVDYLLPKGFDGPLPMGIRPVETDGSVDVMHHVNGQFLREDWPGDTLAALGVPWVATWHINANPGRRTAPGT